MDLLYRGPALIEYLDALPSMNRMAEGPVRVPVVDRYKVRRNSEQIIVRDDASHEAVF